VRGAHFSLARHAAAPSRYIAFTGRPLSFAKKPSRGGHEYESGIHPQRAVCGDGGNPDPSSTQGKKPELAKAIELDGWDYPQHLAGRAFAVVVHGDTEGAQKSRHALADWLSETGLIEAGSKSQVDRYIGYYEPYATSHMALDRDEAIFEETRHAVRSLAERVQQLRSGITPPGTRLRTPRKK